ncbi:hypothetical protein Ahy_A06g030028 [Arachis hypogaea]|uniref:Uncharacterized protein n=1 Tax=Arachis hypogaea TaxID=3818 RepID=A0A445CV14_ARAHY|nr:hypothetical protein Ahy_A06g030028 [Arachis hypogaea]
MSMAGTERDHPQKQLLSLIRNFASEKSQGERRVVTLRKQIEKLTSDLSVVNVELEDAKRCKELTEQEIIGFEVQFSMSEASAQTLEARISRIQYEISALRSEVETLKMEEAALREQFIHSMLDLNAKIRRFHESIINCDIEAVDCEAYTDAPQVNMKENENDDEIVALESMLSDILSQTTKEDEEYRAEIETHKKVQQELLDCETKVSLLNTIVTETRALQDLTIYPCEYSSHIVAFLLCCAQVTQTNSVVSLIEHKQTSTLEATYNTLVEELQRRCICPSCHMDNLEAISALLLPDEDK